MTEVTGVDQAVANLKAISKEIDSEITDWLEESGQVMAEVLNAEDRLNVAHDTFTTQRRKAAVAVGPSKAGGRAHIVRFHEFGTVNHKATPLIRPVADHWDLDLKTRLTKKIRKAIEARKAK